MDIEELGTAGYEQVLALRAPEVGLTAFIAVHDTRLGPAFGGIRCHAYPDAAAALADALRLAAAMTLKCAAAGIAGGGGKAVVVAHGGLDRERAFRAIGGAVEGLGGRFRTGPDAGTTAADLAAVARATRFVATPDGTGGDLAASTAEGVLAGIEATAVRLGFQDLRDLGGVHVAVHGLGAVGGRLADALAAAGARLTVADLDAERARAFAARLGATAMEPDALLACRCDVLAPCALGGVIDAHAAARLRARAVAGAANNVLADASAGALLFERGVLYAPDFVINAGALIHGATVALTGMAPPPAAVRAIGPRVGAVLDEAARTATPPEVVAERIAQARLHAARAPNR